MKKKDSALLLLLLLGGGAFLLWPKKAQAATLDLVNPPAGFRKLTSAPTWKTTDRGKVVQSLVDSGNFVYWDGADRFWFPKSHDDAVAMLTAAGLTASAYDADTNIWTIP